MNPIRIWSRFLTTGTERLLASFGLLALRLNLGLVMLLVHGMKKVENYETMSKGFPDPLGVGHEISLILAIFAEIGCSALLILGLGTRLAAIPLLFTMCIAFFHVHGGDEFKLRELSLMFGVGYLTLLLTGPGVFSVDRLIGGKRE